MKRIIGAFFLMVAMASSSLAFELSFLRDFPVDAKAITAVEFDGTGHLLACGTNEGQVIVTDVIAGDTVFSTRKPDKDVTALAFDAKSRYLVTGSRDHSIIIWDIDARKPEKIIKDFGDDVAHLEVSPDGRYLAACGSKKEIMLWEFPSGFPRGALKGHDKDVVFCGFSADGSRIVSVGEDGKIIVWDLKKLSPIRENEIAAHTLTNSGLDIVSASLSDDRRFLAVGIEEHVLAKGGRRMEFRHNIAFYDWNTGTLLKVLEGNNKRIDQLSLSPDLCYVLTDNSPMHSHELAFWDILGGVIETTYPIDGDITGFDMSMDGNHLAVAYTGEAKGAHVALWDVTGVGGYAPPASGTATPLAETGFGGTISLTGPDTAILADASPHTLAVLYLDAYGIDDGISHMITDELEGKLVNNAPCLKVIERNRIDVILKELKFAQSGMTDQRAIQIGKELEAEYLLYGNVRKTGHDLTISVKMVQVESSQIVGTRGVTCTNASLRDISKMVSYLTPTIAACGR
jgi:WD40 repeat protein